MKASSPYKRDIFLKLFSINDNPQKIAKGYAIGIFLATTPFIGIKVFIALFLTSVLHWNRKASVLGVYHVNALTAPFFYGVAYIVGKAVLGIQSAMPVDKHPGFANMLDMFSGGTNIFWVFLIGGLVLGIPLSYISYIITSNILKKRQKNKQVDYNPFS